MSFPVITSVVEFDPQTQLPEGVEAFLTPTGTTYRVGQTVIEAGDFILKSCEGAFDVFEPAAFEALRLAVESAT
jgi:hypothetical protein